MSRGFIIALILGLTSVPIMGLSLRYFADRGYETPEAEPEVAEAVAEEPELEPEPTDYLVEGKAQGYSAAVAAQTAENRAWGDVVSQWDEALRLLEQVPEDSSDYAEAQAKIEEYTANRDVAAERYSIHQEEVAARQAEIAARPKPIDNYRAEIQRIDPNGLLIVRVEPNPFMQNCDTCIDITVTPSFLMQNKAVRLEAARNFWRIWASMSSPTEPDKARIRLVTQSGTKVGGSGMLGGSLISVDD